MSDIEFVDGLIIKVPHESAPDFVKMNISIKRAELGNWLRGKKDDWINIVVKESKGGKIYASVDTWKPKEQEGAAPQAAPVAAGDDFDDFNDNIPF